MAATLELETYLRHKQAHNTVAPVMRNNLETDDSADVIASVTRKEDPLQKVLERLDKLKSQLQSNGDQSTSQRPGRPRNNSQRRGQSKIVCWTCKEEGHMSRNCPNKPRSQGNEKPWSSEPSYQGLTKGSRRCKSNSICSDIV